MPLDSTEHEKEYEELGKKLRGVTEETKRFAEDATKEIKGFGSLSQETKAKADEALTKLGEANARLAEIEQKLARRGGRDGGEVELKSLGQHVIDSDRVKAMNSGTRGSASLKIEMKDITSAASTTGATAVAGNSLVPADRQAGFQQLIPDRRMTVRDLITPGETASSAIEYVVETGWTNSAAPVAEGALKPKSDIAFDLRNAPVRTLAHYFKASRQIMDDAPQLRSVIDGRLRFGLQFVEETQLLYGAGTGANIKGIIPQATAFAAPFAMTTPSTIDQLRLALLQASLAEYPASGIVVHLTDLAKMEVLKDTTGNYLIGNPRATLVPTLWGLPVVATQSITAGTFLVGAFKMGAQIFDRMAIEVLISTENEDDFIKNLCTVRGEERLALAVYRPGAFVTGTFT
jgi:HK97 family phage major capsid protein